MKKTYALLILLCVLAPVLIGFGVSSNVLLGWTNNNDWIGFWGSYIGAIIGGVITLTVMMNTRKVDFDENLLNELVYYHVGLRHMAGKIARNQLFGENKITEMTQKSEILEIKLRSRKNQRNYIYCDKMLESLDKVTDRFNELVNFRNEHGIDADFESLYNALVEELEEFIKNIEIYYTKNSRSIS